MGSLESQVELTETRHDVAPWTKKCHKSPRIQLQTRCQYYSAAEKLATKITGPPRWDKNNSFLGTRVEMDACICYIGRLRASCRQALNSTVDRAGTDWSRSSCKNHKIQTG